MPEHRVDPGVGDIEEMDELYEIYKDTEEYDIFFDWSDHEDDSGVS